MRLLVIEDEQRIRAFLGRALGAEGFSVVGAADGEDGLAVALRGDCDLVLLDLLLPRVDGFAVLRRLGSERPELPVLVVSARADVETKVRGFELGARDYLTKPFSLDELLARIRVHLRRQPVPVGSVLTVGDVTLDLARRQAWIGEAVAELSDREFKLLHHLLEHAGEVVSRERLLSNVWGYHFDPGSNVVDVCVRRLRRKLGPGAPIETVRNAGYRLAS